jgi:membrane associated rhomboid family serine protease
MIPIRDHTPSGRTPLVTFALIGANVLVFVYMLSLDAQGLDAFVREWAVTATDIVRGENLKTLISSMFLHGGFAHIIGNMLFLHIFGDNLEDKLGHVKYLGYYLAAGLAGSVLQIVADPSSTTPMLGASGAIAGVMGGYLVLFPHEKVDVLWSWGFMFERTTVSAKMMLLYWIFFQFIAGMGSLGIEGGGVAYMAHIGGFAFGWGAVKLMRKNVVVPRVRQE